MLDILRIIPNGNWYTVTFHIESRRVLFEIVPSELLKLNYCLSCQGKCLEIQELEDDVRMLRRYVSQKPLFTKMNC